MDDCDELTVVPNMSGNCDRDGPAAGRAFVNALIASALGDPALAVKARIRPRWAGAWPPRPQRCPEDAFKPLLRQGSSSAAAVLRPRAGRGLSPATFRRDFVRPSRPVLLTELMEGWRCAAADGAAFMSALSDQRFISEDHFCDGYSTCKCYYGKL